MAQFARSVRTMSILRRILRGKQRVLAAEHRDLAGAESARGGAYFGIKLRHAVGADAVAKPCFGLCRDIPLDFLPLAFAVANLFAMHADRDDAPQYPDFLQC